MEIDNIKEFVKEIWSDGVQTAEEINRLFDPSEIKQGIDEEFDNYWITEGDSIINKINSYGRR